MKKIISSILLLFSLSFVFPSSIYADLMGCNQIKSQAYVDNDNLTIVSKVTTSNPNNTGYTLTLLEYGQNKKIVTSNNTYTVPGTNDVDVTFTIPIYQAKNLGLTKVDDHVSFRITEEGTHTIDSSFVKYIPGFENVDGLFSRDCPFDVNISENIANAINDYQSVAACEGPNDCPEGSTCLIRGSQGRTNICVDSNGNVVGAGGGNTSLPDPTCNGGAGVETALGCLPTEASALTEFLLTTGTSIGAGLAFILMLFGAFTIITSAGNPDALKKGKEIIVSALVGLLFIIFSVFLLKLIGVDIIKIPTLTSTINQDARPGGLGH